MRALNMNTFCSQQAQQAQHFCNYLIYNILYSQQKSVRCCIYYEMLCIIIKTIKVLRFVAKVLRRKFWLFISFSTMLRMLRLLRSFSSQNSS